MTIRKEIKVVAAVVFSTILIALATLTFYFVESQREVDEIGNAGEIIAGVTRLRFAAVETLLYGGERPHQQWNQAHKLLDQILVRPHISSSKEEKISRRLKNDLGKLEFFYQRLLTEVVFASKGDPALQQDAAARTSSEILLTSQGMLDGATELYRVNLNQIQVAQKIGAVLLLLLIIVLSMVVTWVLVLVRNRVLEPLTIFESGMKEVALGNLAHRFQLSSNNEIGQLGLAFDHMTAQLQELYSKLSEENILRQEVQVKMQLANIDLEKARDQANTASLAKGEFLANMSHEIRTPLNAVMGMLRLVQMTALEAKQKDYLSKAQLAAKSLLGLLNDILDFSKLQVEKLQLDLHPFDLEELMRELAVVLSGTERAANVEIIFDIDSELPQFLTGDRLRLLQILINLAGNAIKFTQSGQVVIRLMRVALQSNKLTLRVEVTDTGIGISSDQLGRIFDGFTQAEASTTRRFGGTGLGLVISQRLVSMMGGSLLVESNPGCGSRFWFDISLGFENSAEVAVIPTSLPDRLHVLVVAHNAIDRKILIKTLAHLGWSVDGASGGAEGVNRVREAKKNAKPYDVVFMDWQMPGLDGLASASLINQIVPSNQLPIIMLSAFGQELLGGTDIQTDLTFAAVLTKPFTQRQLVTTVQMAIAERLTQENVLPLVKARDKRLQDVCILLVEDNALNRQVATELLLAEGAQLDVAEGGISGVTMATQNGKAYDVVIMDVQMPDLDGLEATRRIRAFDLNPQPPILAMTANFSMADRDNCLAAGMNDHVGKPLDIDEVVSKLLVLIGRDGQSLLLGSDIETRSNTLVEDPANILKRFGDKINVYRMALSGFKSEGERLVTELERHAQQDKLPQAGATLHALKGVAATVGATALAKLAADLECATKAQPYVDASILFSHETVAKLIDLIKRSDAILNATMPKEIAKVARAPAEDLVVLSSDHQITMLREIQALLRVGNLRAIDMAEELLALTMGDDREKVQELLNTTKKLEFGAADKHAQSLLESRD